MDIISTPSDSNTGDCAGTQTLSDLPLGETAVVREIRLEGKLRGYVMRFGLVEETVVTAVRRVPLGNLRVYRIGQSEISLRPETARQIVVTQTKQ